MHQFFQKIITSLPVLSHATAEYSGFNTTSLIPFLLTNDTIPFKSYQSINFYLSPNISSKKYTPFVDTGSTGVVISAIDIPGYNTTNLTSYPVGWEYLSSSRRLYTGYWIPHDLYFNLHPPHSRPHPEEAIIHARVPILCVTTVSICNGTTRYNSTLDQASCPQNADGTYPPITSYPSGIRILGIGFDRANDGMPQGTPDKNPFLNIVFMAKNPVSAENFRAGYIVTKRGVSVGLTGHNMRGMRYVQLSKMNSTTGEGNKFDWGAIPACISINDAPCVKGTALLDTGLNQSYITIPSKTSFTVKPNTKFLADGEKVNIRFGEEDDRGVLGASDNFIVGKGIERGVTPIYVSITRNDQRVPFVNTGRHVFRQWEVAFDAVAGKVGFRVVKP